MTLLRAAAVHGQRRAPLGIDAHRERLDGARRLGGLAN